jgi:molecular chaperone DnaK
MEKVLDARRFLAQVRQENIKEIRQLELDGVKAFFDQHIREFARPSEESAFDNLARTAQREIDRNSKGFESHLEDLKGKNFDVLWRQDWFVVEKFKHMASTPYNFSDQQRFEEMVATGVQLLKADEIDRLRGVVIQLWQIQINIGSETEMLDPANIISG